MTTDADVFVDTNVLLRATIGTMPLHREAAALISAHRTGGAMLWISRQVIREYIAVLTRPQSFLVPLSTADVIARIQMFESLFSIADDTAQVTANLLALLNDYPTGGKQVHDANIVATLLTQNVDDMSRFADRITIVPLRAAAS